MVLQSHKTLKTSNFPKLQSAIALLSFRLKFGRVVNKKGGKSIDY